MMASTYGFRKSSSTAYALMQFAEEVSNSIDNSNYNVGIFVDLKKAFDTVDHEILLKKLYCYGIRCISLRWITNYLSDRICNMFNII